MVNLVAVFFLQFLIIMSTPFFVGDDKKSAGNSEMLMFVRSGVRVLLAMSPRRQKYAKAKGYYIRAARRSVLTDIKPKVCVAKLTGSNRDLPHEPSLSSI